MTLSDALVLLAPSDAALPPAEQARRDDAIVLVHDELQRLARIVERQEDPRDLAHDALLKLIRLGPRYERVTSERAFLTTCLRNLQRDRWRRDGRARMVSIHPDEDGSGGLELADPDNPEDLAMETEQAVDARTRLAEALHVLYADAIPSIAKTLQQPAGFLVSVDDIRSLAADPLAIRGIVAREQREGETFVRARNRVYQRHKRTKAYTEQRLGPWLASAGLPASLDEAVRRIARRDFAPRVERGAGKGNSEEQDA
jgi:DNA-directed RNA polymerase specialized sigma24 family protein